jgi:hypothetical protein
MKCPKCNSEDVQVQPKEYKPKFTVPILLICGGFGLVFLGIVGLVVGLILGAIIAAIVHSVVPQSYQSVMVCQQCGFVGTATTIAHVTQNPLFCASDESKLRILRPSNSTGAVCALGVKIDDFAPFEIGNGDMKFVKLPSGTHTVTYYQVNGLGKDKRKGSVDVVIGEEEQSISFEFLPNGLNVNIQ